MGAIVRGILKALALDLGQQTKFQAFVETGTFLGETAAWAGEWFAEVHTIEIDAELHQKAKERLAGSPVHLHLGDSLQILGDLVPRLPAGTVFWLDAHYSGSGTGKGATECPVLKELALIAAVPQAVILIDDARCFLGPLPPPHDSAQWPGIDEIFHCLWGKFPGNTTTIRDDVIVSVPRDLKGVLDRHWRSPDLPKPESPAKPRSAFRWWGRR